jgi:hypothetical protein
MTGQREDRVAGNPMSQETWQESTSSGVGGVVLLGFVSLTWNPITKLIK